MTDHCPERRAFLSRMGSLAAWTLAGGAAKSLVAPALAAAEQSIPLRVLNPHTNEAYDVELFVGSSWNTNALLACDWLMRDWRQNKTVTCDRRLYAALYVLQRYFAEQGRIRINSGFRTEETNTLLREMGYNTAINSQHLLAKAVDFTIPGVDMRTVAKAAWALNLGGVGFYRNENFVHMDARGSKAVWGEDFL